MNQQNQNPNQPQGFQMSVEDIMKDFNARKASGDISWDVSGHIPVLCVAVYDHTGKKQPEPFKQTFSSKQVEKLKLDIESQIITKKHERLNIDEQIEAMENTRDNVLGVLAAELESVTPKKKLASAAKTDA